MKDTKSSKYWCSLSARIKTPGQTKNKRPDTSIFEANFYKKYLKPTDDVLDIGSGSGLIINHLINDVKNITAVEKYEGFTKFIIDKPNMLVINTDLVGFKMRKEFDSVLCTGVAQCFTKKVMFNIYKNIYLMLKKGGVFISRTHCGLNEDVIIDGYSEELKTDYYAEYRHVDSEVELMSSIGFTNIEVHDVLPDELNVWENTRHFIFVARK